MTLANKDQLALQYTPTIQALENDIASLKKEIVDKETAVNQLYDTYIAEAEGREGTQLIGKGPVYKEKREKHDAELAALQELRINNSEKIKLAETQIAALSNEYQEKVIETQPLIDGFDGLMARVNALDKLPWLPSFFIFLLFLAVETSPILAKLLSSKGAYDIKLEEQENALTNWSEQQAHQRDMLLQTEVTINGKVYEDLAQEEELYQYKRKKARELMQLQADAFFKKQKGILG